MDASTRQVGRASLRALIGMLALGLAACGGGGGSDDGGGNPPVGSGDPWQARTAESDPKAQICASPRTGVDPYSGAPYPDVQGTLADERDWLATYMQEVYLWDDEIPAVDASRYTAATYGSNASAMEAYFYAQLTPAITASGTYKDQFSFVYPSDAWNALSQSGESVGYGMQVAILRATPPREAVVAYSDPGTPAADAMILRGARILAVDGVDLVNADSSSAVATLNAGLFPDSAGEVHTFTILDPGAGGTRDVQLTAAAVTSVPVQNVTTVDTGTGRVGYLLFNDHIATAEGALYEAIGDLAARDVQDLVVDLRYNGGGYLAIAAQLAYMIAGDAAVAGRDFERLSFNDHNPLVNDPGAITPFYAQTLGFDPRVAEGTPLPTLNLDRVFVLVGPGTCSASEAIVNGLRGIGIEVVMIGDTTCGKPYGFFAWDNCGLSYFPIEFVGVNDIGEQVDADGEAPRCVVGDDFAHALGDPNEALFATALAYRDAGGCASIAAKAAARGRPTLLRSPLREFAWRDVARPH